MELRKELAVTMLNAMEPPRRATSSEELAWPKFTSAKRELAVHEKMSDRKQQTISKKYDILTG